MYSVQLKVNPDEPLDSQQEVSNVIKDVSLDFNCIIYIEICNNMTRQSSLTEESSLKSFSTLTS